MFSIQETHFSTRARARALEEEIIKAELAGNSVVEADFHSKLGKEYIPKDSHTQDKKGKLLADIIRRQNLTVTNGLVVCQGTITEEHVTTAKKSAISFVLVSDDMVDSIEAVKIDEEIEHVLTRILKTKNR